MTFEGDPYSLGFRRILYPYCLMIRIRGNVVTVERESLACKPIPMASDRLIDRLEGARGLNAGATLPIARYNPTSVWRIGDRPESAPVSSER